MLSRVRVLIVVVVAACGGAPPPAPVDRIEVVRSVAVEAAPIDDPPTGRLPEGVTPQRYRVALEVVPSRETFSGSVSIAVHLSEATRRIWIHGARMSVSRAAIVLPASDESDARRIPARWDQADAHAAGGESEIAALRTEEPVGPGDVSIEIAFSAPFDRQLKGLYRVEVGEDRYAFTQFEATSARYAFPCFDEPRWKTPFDLELTVRREDVAIANTIQIAEEPIGDLRRVRYATSLPLPTYLVAIAVGPLDVVEAPAISPNATRQRPLPFRGIAARGRGQHLRHALEHTPEILAALEAYFGTEYPYDKLDIIAVPDFASGAMENAGAITFRETLLLVRDDAPEEQLRAFAGVMAHELAHQWFGNLVTMPWWDDIWLNEAFATWMGNKIVEQVYPEMSAAAAQLAAIHGAMGQDSLEAARQIRQPIETDHDIRNAFDAITYSKGGAVLAMFEQWIGEEPFREGIRVYLRQHRLGSATSEHLLAALSEIAGRDVTSPFRTFLEQPGVPLLEVRLVCGGERPTIEIAQSRYTPVGSSAARDRTWSVPVCVTFPTRGAQTATACELVSDASASFPLAEAIGCPAWVMPNAGARGYYRYTLPPEQLRALLDRGWARLSPLERISVANDLRAAFSSAALPAAELLPAMARIAQDETRSVATEPMGLATVIIDSIAEGEQRQIARRWASGLYRARAERVGWTPRARETGEQRLLRRDLLAFLALTAREPRARTEAARRGRAFLGEGSDGAIHAEAVSADLAGVALAVAVQEGDAALFDAMLARLHESQDALLRTRLLAALASTDDPELAQRALDLGLDPRLRVNEVTIPLAVQAERVETRELAWTWTRRSFDSLSGRIASTRAGSVPWIFAGLCDDDHREAMRAFFEPRIAELPGGPRNLRGALEAITLCAARRRAQGGSVATFLSAYGDAR